MATEKSTYLAIVAGRLSDAMTRSALGLAIGILSLLFHRHLEAQLAAPNLEMRTAILDLANRLSALSRKVKSTP